MWLHISRLSLHICSHEPTDLSASGQWRYKKHIFLWFLRDAFIHGKSGVMILLGKIGIVYYGYCFYVVRHDRAMSPRRSMSFVTITFKLFITAAALPPAAGCANKLASQNALINVPMLQYFYIMSLYAESPFVISECQNWDLFAAASIFDSV